MANVSKHLDCVVSLTNYCGCSLELLYLYLYSCVTTSSKDYIDVL